MPKKSSERPSVAENRRARYDYEIVRSVEAGLQLTGSEVKSLREGKASIVDAYASPAGNALFLINSWIPEYAKANRFNHEERRHRKLLLHKHEIDKIATAVQREGMTAVPLRIYFNDRGIAKLELALARGRKKSDKRETEKKRDWQRQKARLLRNKG